MQIQIAQPGPPSMVEMGVFAPPSQELMMAQQQYQQHVYQQLQGYGQAGIDYFNQTKQSHQNFYKDSGMATAQTLANLGEISQGGFSNFYLHPIIDLEGLQNASVEYQPYLMANPVVRQMYLDGRLEGYIDTYDNPEGNVVGLRHQTYRDVITTAGNWMYEDPEKHGYYFRECIGDQMDERLLTLKEKVNVFHAWLLQNSAIEQGQDPSSIDGFDIRPAQEAN